MELEAIGILANAVVLLAGGLVILVKTRKNSKPNKVSEEKFDDQVATCTERFLDIAEKSGQVGADIKSIKESVKGIENKLNERG